MTDATREAAECLAAQICGCADARQRRGDANALLAYHKQAADEERAKIVAWLLAPDGGTFLTVDEIAGAIEAGEHLK